MPAVQEFAGAGGPVLGICNGFQVLLEAGLLPGAMLRNRSVRFQCEHVVVKVERTDTPFTARCSPDQLLRIPIAHGEGNYYAEPEIIEQLEARQQIVFRYATAAGAVTPEANPNGSVHNIAGLCNEKRNVVGMMPHPERACELAVGSADGLVLLESAVHAVSQGAFVTAP
jgi:phosphoribosylformylglycinamidine synthase